MTIFRNTGTVCQRGALILGLVCFAGCGGVSDQADSLLKPVPVKGSVVYKGKPFTGGTIRFEPEDGGREAAGNIGPDGSFRLSTFQSDDGAVAGIHRVAVDPPAGMSKSLPTKYRSAASSGIVVEVAPDKTEYLVELK